MRLPAALANIRNHRHNQPLDRPNYPARAALCKCIAQPSLSPLLHFAKYSTSLYSSPRATNQSTRAFIFRMPPPPTWTPIHLRAESPNTRAAANPVDQVPSSSSGTLPTSTWVPIHKRVSKSPVSQSSSSLVVKSPGTPFVKKDFRDSPVAKVLATSHKQCGKGADAKFRTGLEGSTWAK